MAAAANLKLAVFLILDLVSLTTNVIVAAKERFSD